jgi:hypothetical protein
VVADRVRGRRAAVTPAGPSRVMAPGRGLDGEHPCVIPTQRAGAGPGRLCARNAAGSACRDANSGSSGARRCLRRRVRAFTHKAG